MSSRCVSIHATTLVRSRRVSPPAHPRASPELDIWEHGFDYGWRASCARGGSAAAGSAPQEGERIWPLPAANSESPSSFARLFPMCHLSHYHTVRPMTEMYLSEVRSDKPCTSPTHWGNSVLASRGTHATSGKASAHAWSAWISCKFRGG